MHINIYRNCMHAPVCAMQLQLCPIRLGYATKHICLENWSFRLGVITKLVYIHTWQQPPLVVPVGGRCGFVWCVFVNCNWYVDATEDERYRLSEVLWVVFAFVNCIYNSEYERRMGQNSDFFIEWNFNTINVQWIVNVNCNFSIKTDKKIDS